MCASVLQMLPPDIVILVLYRSCISVHHRGVYVCVRMCYIGVCVSVLVCVCVGECVTNRRVCVCVSVLHVCVGVCLTNRCV